MAPRKFGMDPLVAVHPPTNQTVKFPFGERPRIRRNVTGRNRRVHERVNLAAKFLFERRNKFRKPCSKARNADGLNALLPGVLVIRCDWENVFEQHVRSKIGAARGQFRAPVTAKNALANDNCGQRCAGNACQKRGPCAFEQSHRRER